MFPEISREIWRKTMFETITEKIAPNGKFRIIGVDLFDKTDYVVGDYDAKYKAFGVADDYNKMRSGPMDNVYYVYDDHGLYIRGNEAVGQEIEP